MQVSELLGRPLRRTFGPLLKAQQLHPGFGYDIVPPPPNMEVVTASILTALKLSWGV